MSSGNLPTSSGCCDGAPPEAAKNLVLLEAEPGTTKGTKLRDAPSTRLALTTNPGLEDLAAEEFAERIAAMETASRSVERLASGLRGRVLLSTETSLRRMVEVASSMRSIHHILLPLEEVELPEDDPLDAIVAACRSLGVPGLTSRTSFRVTANRRGTHSFTSIDVQRVAGAVLAERTGAPVDLKNYALNLRIDIVDRRCAMSLQLSRTPLSHRHALIYRQRVALRPNVAYAALRLARFPAPPRRIADPFCGSGTILLEGGAMFPDAELLGSDRDPRAVEGTLRNLAVARLTARARVVQGDARRLAAFHAPGSLDAIVTNPPYGQRIGRGVRFFEFYRRFLIASHEALTPGGRLVLLAHKRDAFRAAVRRAGGFRIRHIRVIETSGLFPAIFVLERL